MTQICLYFLDTGEPHAGILIVPQQQYSIGECLRGMMKLVASKTPEEAINQICFLGNFLRD
jgi:hypothetical protein